MSPEEARRLTLVKPTDSPLAPYLIAPPEPLGRGFYRLRFTDHLTPDQPLIHEIRLGSLLDRWALCDRLVAPSQTAAHAALRAQLDALAHATAASLQLADVPLVDYADMLTQSPLQWAIDGLLPQGVLASLTGRWGSGKSFLAVSWAIAMGSGRPWLGRSTQHGGVVYVAAEGCRAERLIAHEQRYGATTPRLWFRKQALQLGDPRAVDAFLKQCDALPNRPQLVILDTLARCSAGLKENDASDAAIAIQACDRIIKSQGSTVLVLHHPGHGDGAGGGQDRGRGSSAFDAACDTTLLLKKRDGGLSLTVTKQKDADEGEPMRLKLAPSGPALVIEMDDLHGQTEGHMDADLVAVLEVVRDAVIPPGGTDLRSLVKRQGNMSTDRAQEAYAAAKARGLIETIEGRKQQWSLSEKGRMALALQVSK